MEANEYHLLFISHIDEEGRISWASSCPFEPDDPRRSCLYGYEPRGPCLWSLWEDDDHHPDCDDQDQCELTVKNVAGHEVWPCWEFEPEECDSFEHHEYGHMHHENGCGLKFALTDYAMGEFVYFEPTWNPPVPIPVKMEWEHDGGVKLTPVTGGEEAS